MNLPIRCCLCGGPWLGPRIKGHPVCNTCWSSDDDAVLQRILDLPELETDPSRLRVSLPIVWTLVNLLWTAVLITICAT